MFGLFESNRFVYTLIFSYGSLCGTATIIILLHHPIIDTGYIDDDTLPLYSLTINPKHTYTWAVTIYWTELLDWNTGLSYLAFLCTFNRQLVYFITPSLGPFHATLYRTVHSSRAPHLQPLGA